MNKRRIASRIIVGLFVIWGVIMHFNTVFGEEAVSETIQRKYNFAVEPNASEVSVFKNSFKRIKMPGLTNYWKEGAPRLPVEAARILLPSGREVGEVTVIPGKKVALEGNFSVEPGQRPVPLDQEFKAEYIPPKPEIYNSIKPFPEGHMFKVQTVVKRGYRILIVSLSPVTYIPKTGKIAYYRELTVNVETVPEKKPPRTYRGLPGDAELVRKNVDNPEMLSTYPMRQK